MAGGAALNSPKQIANFEFRPNGLPAGRQAVVRPISFPHQTKSYHFHEHEIDNGQDKRLT
jgi:hypothetical protein